MESMYFKEQLRREGRKEFWKQTGDKLRKGIAERRLLNSEPPDSLREYFHIEKKQLNGHAFYEMSPLGSKYELNIFYAHGGAYVNKITAFHWEFLGQIGKQISCKFTIPLYPLAPEYTYKDTFDFVYPLYKQLIEKQEDIILMGDSAGGGLVLALSHLLNEKSDLQPKKIILISPWLDLTLTHPEIDSIEKDDPFLSKLGAIEAGKMYAGGENPTHYLLSPLYGDLNDLPDIMLIMGTHDILAPDARRFVEKAKNIDVKVEYFEFPEMVHIFPIFDFPEANEAKKLIIQTIKKP
ncbi:alpha/beta hydrolase [Cytobacillus sp. FJAT-54145]|uniref:Alpha/beta hydrolase n=1 Tax=Cytobacillus spartinae TaxID=3299023 RepID=A0ABW6K624_9BACI